MHNPFLFRSYLSFLVGFLGPLLEGTSSFRVTVFEELELIGLGWFMYGLTRNLGVGSKPGSDFGSVNVCDLFDNCEVVLGNRV